MEGSLKSLPASLIVPLVEGKPKILPMGLRVFGAAQLRGIGAGITCIS
jgi:hypothetical protein